MNSKDYLCIGCAVALGVAAFSDWLVLSAWAALAIYVIAMGAAISSYCDHVEKIIMEEQEEEWE